MSRRTQAILLSVLAAILAVTMYWNRSESGPTGTVASANDTAAIIAVDNPQLRTDKLIRIKQAKYSGTRRNIFSMAPPPVAPKPKDHPRGPIGPVRPPDPPPPAPLPPLVLPGTVKFYGYAADAQGNHRRACFMNGEEVIIIEEGDTLLGRYRVLRITNTMLDFEEISSGRRASAAIEEQGPNG